MLSLFRHALRKVRRSLNKLPKYKNPFSRTYLLNHRIRFVKEDSGAVQTDEVGTNQLEINKEDCFSAFKLYNVALKRNGLRSVCFFEHI